MLETERCKEKELRQLKKEVDRLIYIFSNSTFANKSQLELLSLDVHQEKKNINSKSQLSQDLFVLQCLKFKAAGFFVEFGAADGINLSNSYLLEKEYEWKGILAEPAKIWKQKLKENRNCIIESKCIWKKSGTFLPFIETSKPELSTINHFSDLDFQRDKRKDNITYEVETLSLNDYSSARAAKSTAQSIRHAPVTIVASAARPQLSGRFRSALPSQIRQNP